MTKSNEVLLAKCDAALLANAAGHVSAALSRKSPVPIMTCILIEPKDGELLLRATNLDMEAGQAIEADCKPAKGVDQRVAVDGQTLQQIVSRMKGEVSLVLKLSPLTLTLVCGRAKVDLGALPAEDWSSFDRSEDAVLMTLPSGLLASALKATSHCQSTEETRYYLNGTYIEDREIALVFTATDGHRLANLRTVIGSVEREGGRFDGRIIPRAAAGEIQKFASWADGPVVLQVGERIVEISAKGRYFAAKLIDGSFPDYERVIPKGETRKIVLKSKELADAVGLVVNVSQERSRSVRFDLHDEHLEVSARGDQHAARAVVEYHEGTSPGEDIADGKGEYTFALNGAYVLAALAVCGELVTLSMTDPASPVLVHEGGDFRQVVMPLRV